jgi:acetyl esterase/lipase
MGCAPESYLETYADIGIYMTRLKSLAAFMTAAAALAACAPVSILNGITPASTFDRTKNVSFGEGDRDVLDIYRSETAKEGAPVLMFVHGGSWDSGSKGIYKFLAEGFTRSGYDIVVPNYRIYPEAKFPNFLEDNAKAVAYTAETFPGRKIVLIGHSAGAYNVLMLGLRDQYLREAGVDRCAVIAGVVGLAAPTGIVPLESERLIEIFPDRFTADDAVLNNVTGPSPAIFLGHGESDTTVYPKNSTALADKITARGGEAQVEIYPGQSHTDVVKVLSRHFDDDTTLKADIVNFIDGLPTTETSCS